jgi:hypothetical protein
MEMLRSEDIRGAKFIPPKAKIRIEELGRGAKILKLQSSNKFLCIQHS